MKKVLKFLIVGILSTLIFGLFFSNSVNLSIDPIFGVVYDYARSDIRERTVQDLNEICENIQLIIDNPELLDNPDFNIEEVLMNVCEKNLEGRELFIEFMKLQTGDIEDVISKNPNLAKYSIFLNQNKRNSIMGIILTCVFVFFLFLTEESVTDFWKTISKILLTTAIFLGLIYLLPKVIVYFLKPDTSFLLEIMNDPSRIFGPQEIILALTPIILNGIFTEKMLIYTGMMFLLSIIIHVTLRVRNKQIIDQKI